MEKIKIIIDDIAEAGSKHYYRGTTGEFANNLK